MTDRTVHVVLIDGFADWEHALPLSQLRMASGYETVTVGVTPEVRSSSGLRVRCDTTVDAVDPASIRVLMVIGGQGWEEREVPAVTRLLRGAWERGAVVAAICGGTLAAARAGLLDERAHTGNGVAHLQKVVPSYRGAPHYRESLAVRDGRLITAPAEGYAEFARELLAALEVMTPAALEQWFGVVKHGQRYAA